MPNPIADDPFATPEFVAVAPPAESRGITETIDLTAPARRVSLPDGFGVDPDELLIALPAKPANRASGTPVTDTPRSGAEPAPILAPRPEGTSTPTGTDITAPKDSPPLIPRGKGGVTPNFAGPAIALTTAPDYVPVNANRTNAGPWKKDAAGADLVGLPQVRDFDLAPMRDLSGWGGVGAPPAGPAINDPDLKKMTVVVIGGEAVGQIQVQISYANSDGGQIRLYTDQTKATEIGSGGFLPNYPTCDFYVEGIKPSRAVNDITVRVIYTTATGPVTDERTLTVTPVVAELSVTPKQGAQVTLLKNLTGQIVGLNSGTQSADGGSPGGDDGDVNKVGTIFTADVNPRTGITGKPEFLQTVTSVTNGNPSGVSLTGVGNRNLQLVAGETFPILDSPNVADKPFYPVPPGRRSPDTTDRVHMTAWDTPYMAEKAAFNTSAWAGLITRMDTTFDARLHLVWHFPAPDGTIYTLGRVDWRVVFRGTTVPFPAFSPTADSVITADAAVITNADPPRVTGSIYNDVIQWA